MTRAPLTEEPCVSKGTSTVLKASGGGDPFAEPNNSIRSPVNGRKNYYGSGSVWSAELAAVLFSILQTLSLWGINPRHWLMAYLTACAENGAQPPRDIDPFLPWAMDERRRAELTRPYLSQAPP